GIAAGIGDPARAADGVPLAGIHLGKSINPAWRDTVRGRGIDDPRAAVGQRIGHGDRLAGRVIGQTQHDEVHFPEQGTLGFEVFAPLGRDAAELDGGYGAEPLGDAEAGGAGLTVDEHGWLAAMAAAGLRWRS